MHLRKEYRQCRKAIFIPLLTLFSCCYFSNTWAQKVTDSVKAMDIPDLFRKMLKKNPDTAQIKKNPPFAILPSLGYNPSFGFVIGAKLSAEREFGNPASTDYSIFGLEALYTSKGVITAQARHNVFTDGNKWNFQGNWQLSRYLMTDYGLGTGPGKYTNNDSSFPLRYTFIRLSEKVYYKIGANLYAGGGISLDIRSNIKDEKQTNFFNTPHQLYSLLNGYSAKKYSANGLLLALQYNTREHPIRSYGGIYADLSIRFNQRWLGSTKNAVQLQYDFRKYWSLSTRNPEHVLAIWHWASYKLSGNLPYLELPSTGSDTYVRSGRGYTVGRFRGPEFAYFETEYRFPITRNKLLSGVCFFNVQSASDDFNKKIFNALESGAGAGLRILFQKQSRSTLCIDFAKGNYGSSGIFFGLSEVF
jgi:outer membrane protein assembly factor BamA